MIEGKSWQHLSLSLSLSLVHKHTHTPRDNGQIRCRQTGSHEQCQVLVPRLLQNGHFLLKPVYLVRAGVGHREPFDGHLSVPVSSIDFGHWATPN